VLVFSEKIGPITPSPFEMEGYVVPSGSSTCIEIPNNGPTFVA
jgi:hypothetical protein